jgi:hypothetical protein
VLGLAHASSSDSLMFRTTGWTNPPPDISTAEASVMLASALTRPC